MIKKWDLLCIKKKDNLDLGHLLLYNPYKNIINNLIELAIDIEKISFDPVSKIFDGLESVPEEIKEYYESLIGITSYYQASKGGRGKYIEKKLSSIFDYCSLDIKLSELSKWLSNPILYRKRGIFTIDGLTSEEKIELRNIEYDWLIDFDETIDLGSYFKDKNKVVFMELKNRIDSGGTAARREVWTKKFKNIISILLDKKVYRNKNRYLSLIELLEEFNINKLHLYLGILFNINGFQATLEDDRKYGFYSSNIEGLKDLERFLQTNGVNIQKNIGDLIIDFKIKNLEVEIGTCYGDDIPKILFEKDYSVNDLLILKYDDIWLTLLTVIEERTFLLKFKENFTIIFLDLLKRDRNIRDYYNEFINSEGNEEILKNLVGYLMKNYSDKFKDKYIPKGIEMDEYLSDIIQIISLRDS